MKQEEQPFWDGKELNITVRLDGACLGGESSAWEMASILMQIHDWFYEADPEHVYRQLQHAKGLFDTNGVRVGQIKLGDQE